MPRPPAPLDPEGVEAAALDEEAMKSMLMDTYSEYQSAFYAGDEAPFAVDPLETVLRFAITAYEAHRAANLPQDLADGHIFGNCPKDGCRNCRSFHDVPIYGKVLRDGQGQRQMKCPGCQQWADIDEDQFFGNVSIDCPNCDYHETINLHREGLDIEYRR